MKTALLLTLALAAGACTNSSQSPVSNAPPEKPAPAQTTSVAEKTKPAVPTPVPVLAPAPIEVCFVLDTTGSMSGLIEGAKQKIWSIANQTIKENPKRPLKIALVPYRDRGDTYITKVFDLTDDLDTLYKDLMQFRAEGGGDGPESVNQALHEAVHKLSWSKISANDATRIIFLVGDYPPHMDYANDIKYPETLKDAVKMNIIVNTIQCGNFADTTPVWQEIARNAEGTYLALSQTGNMVAVATPVDSKIVELNKELAKTVVPYGSVKEREVVHMKAAAPTSMPMEAAAARSSYNLAAGGKVIQGKGDLVEKAQVDKDALKNVKAEELPEDLRKMSEDQRKTYVDSQIAKRQQLNSDLQKLTQQRDEFVKAENARLAGKGDSFDQKVAETIQDQANRKRK